MKKMLLITILCFAFTWNVNAHKQHAHVAITQEAYNLLKLYLGQDVLSLLNHLTPPNGTSYGGQWRLPYITSGAWMEDETDIVYFYSFDNPPDIPGLSRAEEVIISEVIEDIGLDDFFISTTHFWDADNGDVPYTNMYGAFTTPLINWGNFTVNFSVPNAYEKIKKLANGEFEIKTSVILYDMNLLYNCPRVLVTFRYNSLIDLYKNKNLYITRIDWLDGIQYLNNFRMDAGHWSASNDETYDNFVNCIVFEVLGRMCHLLQDMSVPAHAHKDMHGDNIGLRVDSYEDSFGELNWTAEQVFNQVGNLIDPTNSEDPIHYLMYITQQMADHFGTNGPHGGIGDDILGGNPRQEELDFLNSINFQDLGGPTLETNPASWAQVNYQRNILMPQAIRATAGLLYWFACGTNLIQQVTVKNNFENGTIKVGLGATPTTVNSPCALNIADGLTVTLEAVNQTYANVARVWNTVGSTASISKWQKNKEGNTTDLLGGLNRNYSFISAPPDDNSSYIANLMKNCHVVQYKQTEFNGNIAGSDFYIVEQNNVQLETPGSGYTPNSIPYMFAGWNDELTANTIRTITPETNSTYASIYKYPTHSNQTNAYSSNSQRKFIKTEDGKLHNVYQSMDKVWYEMSTDNGVTWKIMNNGRQLNDYNAKNPSITSAFNDRNVLISFQEGYGEAYNIKILSLNYLVDLIQSTEIFSIARPYSEDSHPVAYFAGYQSNRYLLLVWEQKGDSFSPGGIYYIFGDLVGTVGQTISFQNSVLSHISNTDNTYCNPTIAGTYVTTSDLRIHLAYQQDVSTTQSKIWYHLIDPVANGTVIANSTREVSYGSGYTKNYNPSIIEINNGSRLCWVGEREIAGDDPDKFEKGSGVEVINNITTGTTEKAVVFKSPDYYRFWYFGSNVQLPSIIKSADNLYYNIAWNETTTNYNKYADNTLSTIRSFNMPGNSVQVCNGATKSNMLGMVFDARTIPYSFNKTIALSSLGKTAVNEISINYGRQGLVKNDSLQFYFALGDIKANEQSVSFTNVPEEYAVTGLETLNSILISEPFIINDGESFIYSVQYGVVSKTAEGLQNDQSVNFKVKLIDVNTGELLRVFDNVTYSANNLEHYNNILYSVNVNGVGNKTVKLCLEVSDNLEAEYFVADKFTDESIFAKANIQQVELNETVVIKDYDLFQNYPNPFNPSTTISFQMPKDGFVTLKIYDILGKEVTTLVNEFKTTGKYNVQFNASNLASGMYIYQIKAGDYSNTKKLMLMK
ncbi:MAG: T9SS type A sorting domain-containing protein [bacterium]